LMALYFLQVDPSTRMPCLPTSLFTGEGGVPKEAKITWNCTFVRTELLYRFFRFFSSDFRWGAEVVSIRLGRRALSTETDFEELKGRHEQRLHIEDPFLLSRNLHCVLRLENEYTLWDEIVEAEQALQRGEAPKGLTGNGKFAGKLDDAGYMPAAYAPGGAGVAQLRKTAMVAGGFGGRHLDVPLGNIKPISMQAQAALEGGTTGGCRDEHNAAKNESEKASPPEVGAGPSAKEVPMPDLKPTWSF